MTGRPVWVVGRAGPSGIVVIYQRGGGEIEGAISGTYHPLAAALKSSFFRALEPRPALGENDLREHAWVR